MENLNFCRINGEKIFLSSFRNDEDAIKLYTRWINDNEVTEFVGYNAKVTSFAREKELMDNTAKDTSRHHFSIIEKESYKLIGTCSIKPERGGVSCSLGILIGDKDSWNKGYGTEVIKLLIKFAFEELRVHRVGLTLDGGNERAHKCYLKAGLKDCGVCHETIFRRGEYFDMIYMEILENEYFS